mmetsp:Transcript_5199/g.5415  ORF Transcript_5199/g.5415 Transcript_5199/m.5415 type:complete len:88 (-) Transcript_5199:145-408(-)
MDGAMSLYHSFLRKGSIAFLREPFLLFVKRLFFPYIDMKEKEKKMVHNFKLKIFHSVLRLTRPFGIFKCRRKQLTPEMSSGKHSKLS